MDETQVSGSQRWKAGLLLLMMLAIGVVLNVMTFSKLGASAGVSRYDAALPFVVLFGLGWLFAIPRVSLMISTAKRQDTEEAMAPTYPGERAVLLACFLGALFAPFIVNPIVHHAVYPALGYSYCKPLTTYQRPFRFPTYAYVADPALCPE